MSYKERIDAIRGRDAAATEGPWIAGTYGDETRVMLDFGIDSICCMQVSNCPNYRNDRDFIAHARADIPYLLARITALEAALYEAIDLYETWISYEQSGFEGEEVVRENIARLTAIQEGREHE